MKTVVSLFAVVLLTLSSGMTLAEEQVFGWELMNKQERIEHREKMRSLKTEEAREQYRMEHHERMLERAKERGVTLPDPKSRTPMGPGNGMGPGQGMGQGMGQGKGK